MEQKDTEFNEYDDKEKDIPKSYEDLVWYLINRTMRVVISDTKNVGKMWVQNEAGQRNEIVKPDNRIAFINGVRSIYAVIKERCEKEFREKVIFSKDLPVDEACEESWNNFEMILKHLHKSGIFGHETMRVFMTPMTDENYHEWMGLIKDE